MRKAIFGVILLLLLAAPVGAKSLIEEVKEATMILYAQTEDGGMEQLCTTTIYQKLTIEDKPGYLLATAAHCVAVVGDDLQTTKRASAWFVSFDEAIGPRVYHPAHVEGYGSLTRGDDFAVLHVYTSDDWPVMKLGLVGKVKEGDEVLSVAAPQGLGRQVFRGSISLLSLDRVINEKGIHWQYAMLVQLPAGGGSSGAAIVSIKQKAIVGITVGLIGGNPSVVALPISRFKAFVRRASGIVLEEE